MGRVGAFLSAGCGYGRVGAEKRDSGHGRRERARMGATVAERLQRGSRGLQRDCREKRGAVGSREGVEWRRMGRVGTLWGAGCGYG